MNCPAGREPAAAGRHRLQGRPESTLHCGLRDSRPRHVVGSFDAGQKPVGVTSMNRRQFFLGLIFQERPTTLQVEVMEVFSSSDGPSAFLVHHASDATRNVFTEAIANTDFPASVSVVFAAVRAQAVCASIPNKAVNMIRQTAVIARIGIHLGRMIFPSREFSHCWGDSQAADGIPVVKSV